MKKNRMLLIEFNELCPSLLHRWMEQGLLPNFKLFYENSQAFETESDVKDPDFLEPWIQWYSMHTGLHYDKHEVFHLTDGPKAPYKDIWQRLLDEGKQVGNFSSMNCRALNQQGAVFLPDPWCLTEKAYPEELNIFHKFSSAMVQEHTNKDKEGDLRLYVEFLRYSLMHGLSLKTVMKISKQLLNEKTFDSLSSWKRAPLLDQLQLDVFNFYEKRHSFHFSTFFSNSTAHYQHAYWRHMEPESFTVRPSLDDLKRYGNAILFGYQEMDGLLGHFSKLEDEGVVLVLATALSQQPYLKKEEQGGAFFYRPKNIEKFLNALGISYEKIFPVMTHQFLVHFQNHELTDKAFLILQSLKYEGRNVFGFDPSDPCTLYFDIRISSEVPQHASIESQDLSLQSFQFFDVFYKLDVVKSGCHHPNGVLWFKTGQHRDFPERVSILDVFPTILGFFDISPDTHERKILSGENLSFVFES